MECFHLPHYPHYRPALSPVSIPLFMPRRHPLKVTVEVKVKVAPRVSNFRFQSQLHRLFLVPRRSFSSQARKRSKHSQLSKQLSISGRANIFSHLAFLHSHYERLTWPRTSVDFYSILLFFCRMLMVVVALLLPFSSCRLGYIGFGQDIGKVSSQAQRWQRQKVVTLCGWALPPRVFKLKLGSNRFLIITSPSGLRHLCARALCEDFVEDCAEIE